MTAYQHRIILIVPAAKIAAVASWFQANIGPNSVDASLGPGLNAAGDASAATHNWLDGCYTDAECRQILAKLCQLASITPPTLPTWQSWTQQQKISWLKSVQASIRTNYGVYVTLADNRGTWDDPDACLAAMNLKRQTVA